MTAGQHHLVCTRHPVCTVRISAVKVMKDEVTARIRHESEYCRGWCRESSLEEVVCRKSGSFIVEVYAVRLEAEQKARLGR